MFRFKRSMTKTVEPKSIYEGYPSKNPPTSQLSDETRRAIHQKIQEEWDKINGETPLIWKGINKEEFLKGLEDGSN